MSKSKTTNAKIDNEELKSLLLNGFYNYIGGMMGIDANANQDSAVEHFSMNADVEFLRNVLKVLKQEGWVSNKTKDSDWIFRLTGINLKKGKPSNAPIVFTYPNQCRYMVKNMIFADKKKVSGDNWKKVMSIFTVLNGDIAGVKNANKIPAGSIAIDRALSV